MDQEQIIEIFQKFLDENGMYHKFLSFLEEEGVTPQEIGIDEE
jgi:hypothetical protein